MVVGHPDTDAPAFGWAKAFDFSASEDRLHAEIGDLEPAFADAVRDGRYRKVSLAMFPPDHSANPTPGAWYPKHIGFLGGAAPAVPGLKNVQFDASTEGLVCFEAPAAFGDPGLEEAAGILRLLRDWMIDTFGMEDADRALPS